MRKKVNLVNCNAKPRIPSWAHKTNPLAKHVAGGTIYAEYITSRTVFREGDCGTLSYREFVDRGQAISYDAMNACAADFYIDPENWLYLPNHTTAIVFVNTEFRDINGKQYVTYFYRDYSNCWVREYKSSDTDFNTVYRIAVIGNP